MLQLVNVSNYSGTNSLFQNNAKTLTDFLTNHNLYGLEMIFVDKWDKSIFPANTICGAHLWFWGDWLDFWHGNNQVLLSEYKSTDEFLQHYLTLDKEQWIENFSQNITQSQAIDNISYMVFHVANSRFSEVYSRKHYYSDEQVIDATIDLVNRFTKHINPKTQLLFENLWWPGLTLNKPELIDKLFSNVHHQNCGIMLDTGHLINTNLNLSTQDQAIEYILTKVNNLGQHKEKIFGLHLHQSLSGQLAKKHLTTKPTTIANAFDYINKIDTHQPFTTPNAQKLIQTIQPKYLVHEFFATNLIELSQKICTQQQALGLI